MSAVVGWKLFSSGSAGQPLIDIPRVMAYVRQMPPTSSVVSQSLMTPNLELTMSLFPENGLGYPGSLAPNDYPFGNLPPNSLFADPGYNAVLLQNQMPMLSAVARPPHPPPQAREARNAMSPINQRLSVKLEDGSTLRPHGMFTSTAVVAQSRRETAPRDLDFGTDVDSLMRAIQTKSRPKHHPPEQPRQTVRSIPLDHQITQHGNPNAGGAASHDPKARKRYQCHLPTCAKSFFQKTHLEIHMRAHTGDKPFVGIDQTMMA